MKYLSKQLLNDLQITWVEPGQEVPFMQGAALNKLNKEYPTRKPSKTGYFLYSPTINHNPLDLDEACYYLIERNVEKYRKSFVAFQECGSHIQGVAIFTDYKFKEDKGKPEPGKLYSLTGATGKKSIMNGNTWKESELRRCKWCQEALKTEDDLLCGACAYKQAFSK